MASKPVAQPRWDQNLTAVAIPTPLEEADGYPINATPTRQKLNWLWNLWRVWINWLDQVRHPTDLDFADGPLPGGTPPTVGGGSGLLDNQGDFSARVIAGGRSVPETGNDPAINYNPTTDNYLDLDFNGLWHNTEVNPAGGPAPAIFANSARVYMVRTNATDKTILTDYRPPYPHRLAADFIAGIRHLWEASVAPPSGGIGTFAQRAAAHVTHLVGNLNTSTELVEATRTWSAIAPAASRPLNEYVRIETALPYDRVQVLFAQGIHRSSVAELWVADEATAVMVFETPGRREVWELTGLTPGSSYTLAALAALNPSHREDLFHGLKFIGANPDENRPHIEHTRVSLYTEANADLTAGDAFVISYRGPSIIGGSTGLADAVNARYNKVTGQWDRQVAGDAWLIVTSLTGGRSLYCHPAAGAASWADARAAGAWEVIEDAIYGFVAPKIVRPALATAAVPQNHALYRDNVPKAWGLVQTPGGAAPPVLLAGMNINAVAFNGVTLIRCTMATGFPNANVYGVGPHVRGNLERGHWDAISGTQFDIGAVVNVAGVDNMVNISTTGRTIYFSVFGNQ